MKFIDETEIDVRSGDGGPGLISFRAAKYQPKAGIDGGDGGFGGHVYLVGNSQLNSLSGLYYRSMYAAGNGERGGTNNCTGASGADMEIPVPIGTIAYDRETGELVAEVLDHNQKVRIAEGGKRGLGNYRFVSSTHQAPEEATQGGKGVEISLRLELKLIADVGFAGFPNAGKSTLLSVISAATPKIADYPFTTLTPQLGIVDIPGKDPWNSSSFIAADIPGLIEGASEGKGLGHEFLRHLERTKVITFVLDSFPLDETKPVDSFKILENELLNFSEKLYKKKRIALLTKADLAPADFDWSSLEDPLRALGLEVLRVSSVAGEGIQQFKRRAFEIVQEEKNRIEMDALPARRERAADEGYIWITRADEDRVFGI